MFFWLSHFELLTVNSRFNSILIPRHFHVFPTATEAVLHHIMGRSMLVPVDRCLCPVLSGTLSQLFPLRIHLQICNRQDSASAIQIDDIQSLANSPGAIRVWGSFFSYATVHHVYLYAVEPVAPYLNLFHDRTEGYI